MNPCRTKDALKRLLAATLFCLVVAGPVVAALTPEQEKTARALITQFADRRFAVRQQAVDKLVAMGPDVIPVVQKTLADTTDAEVKLRCEMTLKKIMDKYGVILDGEKPGWDRHRWIEEAKKHDCNYTPQANRDKAVECYRKAISAMPASMNRMALEFRVAQLLGSVYQASKGEKARPDEAIAAYEGILKTYKPVQRRVINAMLLLGNLYKRKKDSVAAARCYEALLNVDMDKLELPPDFEATAGSVGTSMHETARAAQDARRGGEDLQVACVYLRAIGTALSEEGGSIRREGD